VKAVAKTLHKHLTNLLTYFMHPITTPFSEGFNSRIRPSKPTPALPPNSSTYRLRIPFSLW